MLPGKLWSSHNKPLVWALEGNKIRPIKSFLEKTRQKKNAWSYQVTWNHNLHPILLQLTQTPLSGLFDLFVSQIKHFLLKRSLRMFMVTIGSMVRTFVKVISGMYNAHMTWAQPMSNTNRQKSIIETDSVAMRVYWYYLLRQSVSWHLLWTDKENKPSKQKTKTKNNNS